MRAGAARPWDSGCDGPPPPQTHTHANTQAPPYSSPRPSPPHLKHSPSVSQSPQPPIPLLPAGQQIEIRRIQFRSYPHSQKYPPRSVCPHSCWCNTPLRVLVSTSTRSSRWPLPRGAAPKQVCSIGFQKQGEFSVTRTELIQVSESGCPVVKSPAGDSMARPLSRAGRGSHRGGAL